MTADASLQPTGAEMTWLRRVLGIDLRALACFRVGIAAIVVVDVLSRSRDLAAHYTDSGLLPSASSIWDFSRPGFIHLHALSGAAPWQVTLFAVAIVCAVMMMLGYRTRLATVVTWLLLVSLHNRNQMVLNSGDVLLRCMVFWAMFLPLGAKYSIDSALDKKPPANQTLLSFATVAALVQLMCIYVLTALEKYDPAWRDEGTAIFLAMHLDAYTKPLGIWLRQFPDLLFYMTKGIWLLEFAGVAGLFITWPRSMLIRTLTAFAFIGFHFGLFLTMYLGFFPWVCIVSWLLFLPAPFWDGCTRLLGRFQRRERGQLHLFFDGDCGFCKKMVALVTTALMLRDVPSSPAQSDPDAGPLLEKEASWVLRDADGSFLLRSHALARLVGHSPLWWPLEGLLSLAPITRIGDALYKRIADGRSRLGPIFAKLFPWRSVSIHSRTWAHLTVLLFLLVAHSWNLTALPQIEAQNRRILWRLANVTRLDQRWNMFSPYPSLDDGWYVIEGTLDDGTKVDVYNLTLDPPSRERPEDIALTYKRQRWRKYLNNLWRPASARHRVHYSRYLCRTWAAAHSGESPLHHFAIDYMLETTTLDGPEPVERLNIWNHSCA